MEPLKINKTFQNLIPPLSRDEFHSLEESILSQGCRDTIKLWRNTIIDGHNRYEICQKHDIPYTTQTLRFSSQKDAELWIVQNQLGRRNLTNAMRIKLALHKEALLREKAKANRKGHQGSPVHVRKAIAKEAGVSEQTVHKYMRIRELGTPEQIAKVDTGQAKISTVHRELEVTTRIVECFHSPNLTPNITNASYEKATLNNLEKLEKLYSFIIDNAAIIDISNDMARVKKALSYQQTQFQKRI